MRGEAGDVGAAEQQDARRSPGSGPMIVLSTVDLPEPLAPTSVTISRAATASDSSSSTAIGP